MRAIAILLLFFSQVVFAQAEPPARYKGGTADKSGTSVGWHFGVGGSYSLTSNLRFDDGTVTGSSEKVTADLEYERTFSLELEARIMNANSWGFMGGLTFDGERKITGGTVTTSAGTVKPGTSDPSKIQATVIYGNAVYRWGKVYLPFGLNMSSIKYTAPSSYTGTVSANGGIGAQLGVGFYITENFVVEGYSRVVGISLKGTQGTTTIDYGNGYLSNIMATGKYIF